MKKLIFISLCALIFAGMALGYSASGRVYQQFGGVVSNPVGQISYPTSSGISPTNSWAGDANGFYSTGWPSTSLIGKTMTVIAYDQYPNPNLAGSKTWTSTSNSETGKNVTVKLVLTAVINPDLVCVLEPIAIAEPGVVYPSTAILALSWESPSTVEVQEFTAVVQSNSSKLEFGGAFAVDSFFDITYEIDIPEPGQVTIDGNSPSPVTIIPGEARTLFRIDWVAPIIESRDLATVDMGLIIQLPVENEAVPTQTEYPIGPTEHSEPYFLLDSEVQWDEALADGIIKPLTIEEWEGYIMQWNDEYNILEGNDPYPQTDFIDPCLYVYEGNESNPDEPNDAGLVMVWGDDTTVDGNYASAWKYDYLLDPDYSNATITVTVTAPQFDPATGSQITQVSIGLQNIPQVGGPVRSWYWNVGVGTSIPWNTPTTITVDCSKTGVAAATPAATTYLNNPGFNITQVQWIIVDENAKWVGGLNNAPPPGGGIPGIWNYWHNLSVTPNIGGGSGSGAVDSKWFVKYSQPPILIDSEVNPPLISGWDERSDYNDRIMADDWFCWDDRPVTDVHWWGSFLGWTQPTPPPIMPQSFHLGIWTDVPDPTPDDPATFSHPGQLLWENICTSYVWNFAGYDVDPYGRPEFENETCFQFAQFLSQDEWFHQEPMEDGPNIYWLSIAPIWTAAQMEDPNFYEWGWKTRLHEIGDDFPPDDAASITQVASGNWPPVIYDTWSAGNELTGPDGIESWDLAFELTTNVAAYKDNPIDGDISGPAGVPDGEVNFFDILEIANHWLEAVP